MLRCASRTTINSFRGHPMLVVCASSEPLSAEFKHGVALYPGTVLRHRSRSDAGVYRGHVVSVGIDPPKRSSRYEKSIGDRVVHECPHVRYTAQGTMINGWVPRHSRARYRRTPDQDVEVAHHHHAIRSHRAQPVRHLRHPLANTSLAMLVDPPERMGPSGSLMRKIEEALPLRTRQGQS
jgi:hypothetical protein